MMVPFLLWITLLVDSFFEWNNYYSSYLISYPLFTRGFERLRSLFGIPLLGIFPPPGKPRETRSDYERLKEIIDKGKKRKGKKKENSYQRFLVTMQIKFITLSGYLAVTACAVVVSLPLALPASLDRSLQSPGETDKVDHGGHAELTSSRDRGPEKVAESVDSREQNADATSMIMVKREEQGMDNIWWR